MKRRKKHFWGDLIWGTFLFVQGLDGILTYVGIRHFDIGFDVEGNPLLRLAMASLGIRVTLTLAKVFAGACGTFIHFHRYHRILGALTAFYVVAAIFPWAVLLAEYLSP